MSEQQNLLDKELGSKDLPKLEAKKVTVQGVRVDEVGAKKNKVVVFVCQHPDKKEEIEFTKVKHLRNDKAKVVGLWYQEDEDGNIQKGSALGEFMVFHDVKSLKEFIGKEIPTIRESEDADYLCLKGY